MIDSNGNETQIDDSSFNNGLDYRDGTIVVSSAWISEWNGSDILRTIIRYIDSQGTEYIDNCYYNPQNDQFY